MEKVKVKPLCGMFWACDLLNGHKPLPTQQKQNKDTEFQSLLDAEIKRLKEEKK